uniref:Uncharacterized protein n=1 Tax=Oryza sativa subsp. japonica TaxID=39947 RepID=Q6YPF6_ORYSJ|nr:hypothetical protein [Oryza sativa Japonica Group]BAD10814.1 hypothetical protein [Oryza sativa Japonica Group]
MAVLGASDNLTVRAMRRRGCAVISNPLNEVQPPPFTMVVMVGIHHPQRVHNKGMVAADVIKRGRAALASGPHRSAAQGHQSTVDRDHRVGRPDRATARGNAATGDGAGGGGACGRRRRTLGSGGAARCGKSRQSRNRSDRADGGLTEPWTFTTFGVKEELPRVIEAWVVLSVGRLPPCPPLDKGGVRWLRG